MAQGGQGGLGTPIPVPISHAQGPTLQDQHCATDASFEAYTNPKKGGSGSLVPQGLEHSAAPLQALSSLLCWDHATLDADMEAPAVLPCRASGQAGVQASISHLHSQERGK